MLIIKRESCGLKYCDDPWAFIWHSNHMDDIYENIDQYNPNIKRNILIIFDDMIAEYMVSNKKLMQ